MGTLLFTSSLRPHIGAQVRPLWERAPVVLVGKETPDQRPALVDYCKEHKIPFSTMFLLTPEKWSPPRLRLIINDWKLTHHLSYLSFPELNLTHIQLKDKDDDLITD